MTAAPVKDLVAVVRGLADGSISGQSIDLDGQQINTLEIFSTDLTRAVLYLLSDGQRIPRHRHTGIDDIFFGVAGRGHIRTWGEGSEAVDNVMGPGRIYAVAPGTVHEVVSDSDEFAYLLLQTPKEDYDLIAIDPAS